MAQPLRQSSYTLLKVWTICEIHRLATWLLMVRKTVHSKPPIRLTVSFRSWIQQQSQMMLLSRWFIDAASSRQLDAKIRVTKSHNNWRFEALAIFPQMTDYQSTCNCSR
jgi:hypothetical protein